VVYKRRATTSRVDNGKREGARIEELVETFFFLLLPALVPGGAKTYGYVTSLPNQDAAIQCTFKPSILLLTFAG
jgi:hypothetical protein